MHKRGKQGITVLRRKIFVTALKFFKEKSLFQKNAGIEKCKELERERRGIATFARFFRLSQHRKSSYGNPCVSENIRYQKVLLIRGEEGGR